MDFSDKIALMNATKHVQAATMKMVCVTKDAIQDGGETTVIYVRYLPGHALLFFFLYNLSDIANSYYLILIHYIIENVWTKSK